MQLTGSLQRPKVGHFIGTPRYVLAHSRNTRANIARAPLSGLDISKAANVASTAMTGAKIGTAILPGIGTAIGAVLGAAASLIGGSKPSVAEQTWDGYKKDAGSVMGRQYEEKGFADIIKGAFDANRKAFLKEREQTLAAMAAEIVRLFKSRSVSVMAGAKDLYPIIRQWLHNSGYINGATFDANKALPLLITDVIDRYVADLPITRADMPAFKGKSEYKIHAPQFSAAVGPITAAPVALPSTPVTAPRAVAPVSTSTVANSNSSQAPAQISVAQIPTAGPTSALAVSQSMTTAALDPGGNSMVLAALGLGLFFILKR